MESEAHGQPRCEMGTLSRRPPFVLSVPPDVLSMPPVALVAIVALAESATPPRLRVLKLRYSVPEFGKFFTA